MVVLRDGAQRGETMMVSLCDSDGCAELTAEDIADLLDDLL